MIDAAPLFLMNAVFRVLQEQSVKYILATAYKNIK